SSSTSRSAPLAHPVLLVMLLIGPVALVSCATRTTNQPMPKAFLADPRALADAKARLAAGDPSLKPALDKLLADAKEALALKPVSVMDKHRIPPSGDKHDYVSQAPYFWRDTNSPDGRYVRRDGEHNPEAHRDTDAGSFGQVC